MENNLKIVTIKERKWMFLAIALTIIIGIILLLYIQSIIVAILVLSIFVFLFLSMRQKVTTVDEMAREIAREHQIRGISVDPSVYFVWNKAPGLYVFEFPINNVTRGALAITRKSDIPVIGTQDIQSSNLADLKRRIEELEIERASVLKGIDEGERYKILQKMGIATTEYGGNQLD